MYWQDVARTLFYALLIIGPLVLIKVASRSKKRGVRDVGKFFSGLVITLCAMALVLMAFVFWLVFMLSRK